MVRQIKKNVYDKMAANKMWLNCVTEKKEIATIKTYE